MADYLDKLKKNPETALQGVSLSNPLLKEIWHSIPEHERAESEMPRRGHKLKQWLIEWAKTRKERIEKAGSYHHPSNLIHSDDVNKNIQYPKSQQDLYVHDEPPSPIANTHHEQGSPGDVLLRAYNSPIPTNKSINNLSLGSNDSLSGYYLSPNQRPTSPADSASSIFESSDVCEQTMGNTNKTARNRWRNTDHGVGRNNADPLIELRRLQHQQQLQQQQLNQQHLLQQRLFIGKNPQYQQNLQYQHNAYQQQYPQLQSQLYQQQLYQRNVSSPMKCPGCQGRDQKIKQMNKLITRLLDKLEDTVRDTRSELQYEGLN